MFSDETVWFLIVRNLGDTEPCQIDLNLLYCGVWLTDLESCYKAFSKPPTVGVWKLYKSYNTNNTI